MQNTLVRHIFELLRGSRGRKRGKISNSCIKTFTSYSSALTRAQNAQTPKTSNLKAESEPSQLVSNISNYHKLRKMQNPSAFLLARRTSVMRTHEPKKPLKSYTVGLTLNGVITTYKFKYIEEEHWAQRLHGGHRGSRTGGQQHIGNPMMIMTCSTTGV